MRKVLAPLTMFVGLIVIAAIACTSSPTPPPPAPQVQSPPPPPAAQQPAPPGPSQPSQPSNGGSGGSGTEFDVSMQDPGGSGEYAFDPSEMTFGIGDTIEFVLESESEYHTFTVDELGIDAEADGGETATVTFTFSEAGTFALICIPHEALGMTGTITVQ